MFNLDIQNIVSIITIIAFFFTLYKYYQSRIHTARLEMAKEFYQLDLLLGSEYDYIKFYGITDDDLKEHNISRKEFAYLVANFTLLSAMHNINPKRKNLLDSGGYINNMLQAEETRVAWPLVRRMFRDSDFTKKIDTFCDDITESSNI